MSTAEYSSIPLSASPYGEQSYLLGRDLVGRHGVRLAEVIWDADEVLWDWVMNFGRLMRAVPRRIRGDWTHMEYFGAKPGVLELIWGMHHESKARGLDPFMRVWTDGYPWRMWRIHQEIPSLGVLLGPVDGQTPETPEAFATHPRLFTRVDFAQAAERLLEWMAEPQTRAHLSGAAHDELTRRAAEGKFGASWKIPELAVLIGKNGFEHARLLIDDNERNVATFINTGRRAVHVENPTPEVLFGKVPNSVWSKPYRTLERLATAISGPISEALLQALDGTVGQYTTAQSTESVPDYEPAHWEFEVPDARIQAEWIQPMKRLRKAHAQFLDQAA